MECTAFCATYLTTLLSHEKKSQRACEMLTDKREKKSQCVCVWNVDRQKKKEISVCVCVCGY